MFRRPSMSASPNSPWIQPERPANSPTQPVKPPESAARWPVYFVIALAVLAAAWVFRPQARKTVAAPPVPTVRAARGMIQNTRRLSGSISAGRFINVGAPVLQAPDQGRGLTLTFLAASG